MQIPCTLMRGGSSKGLFFLARDLPADPQARDRVLLAALGSPDARQIDGMGGGNDHSSKVVLVGPSSQPDADVEYLFAQVSVADKFVDLLPNSGNMLAGVAPFAIEHGLVQATDPVTRVRILNANSQKIVEATVQTPGGEVQYAGDFALDGVPGTAAPIGLHCFDPTGTKTGRLLPTGKLVDLIDGIEVSCIDFAIPMVLVHAQDLGKTGYESKQALDRDQAFMQRVLDLRVKAARLMGLDDGPNCGVPKLGLVAAPTQGGTVAARYFVPGNCHPVFAATGAMALAGACHLPGSVPHRVAGIVGDPPRHVVIEHPSGTMACQVLTVPDPWTGASTLVGAAFQTTARPLLMGEVHVSDACLAMQDLAA